MPNVSAAFKIVQQPFLATLSGADTHPATVKFLALGHE